MKHLEVWKVYISFLDGSNDYFISDLGHARNWLVSNLDKVSCGAVWCRELNGTERFMNMKQVFRSIDCRYIFRRRADGSIKWHECGK